MRDYRPVASEACEENNKDTKKVPYGWWCTGKQMGEQVMLQQQELAILYG